MFSRCFSIYPVPGGIDRLLFLLLSVEVITFKFIPATAPVDSLVNIFSWIQKKMLSFKISPYGQRHEKTCHRQMQTARVRTSLTAMMWICTFYPFEETFYLTQPIFFSKTFEVWYLFSNTGSRVRTYLCDYINDFWGSMNQKSELLYDSIYWAKICLNPFTPKYVRVLDSCISEFGNVHCSKSGCNYKIENK